jgi:phage replication initiation protein
MTVSGGFTQTIDWLAFTLPKAEVADVITLIGGDWFQSETGFRGYPVAQLMTEGKTGVGKLGTGAPRNPKEVHVDLSAGIVSQWDETKLKAVLAWIFAQKGHVTRIDVALDDREASVAVETVRLAVEAGQVVSRSKQFKVIQASNHRQGVRTGETLYFGSRESQTMLRVYDKRLELQSRGREDAGLYGVRWEMEFKQDRAQACAKALTHTRCRRLAGLLGRGAAFLCRFPRDDARGRIVREVSRAALGLVGRLNRRLQALSARGRTHSTAAG